MLFHSLFDLILEIIVKNSGHYRVSFTLFGHLLVLNSKLLLWSLKGISVSLKCLVLFSLNLF